MPLQNGLMLAIRIIKFLINLSDFKIGFRKINTNKIGKFTIRHYRLIKINKNTFIQKWNLPPNK